MDGFLQCSTTAIAAENSNLIYTIGGSGTRSGRESRVAPVRLGRDAYILVFRNVMSRRFEVAAGKTGLPLAGLPTLAV